MIERELDVERAAVRALMPDLPEQLMPGDGGQQAPEVAAATEGVAALSRLDEEASIDREHDVLGICPPRQTGREPAPGQRGEPFEVTGEERLRGQFITAAEQHRPPVVPAVGRGWRHRMASEVPGSGDVGSARCGLPADVAG